MLQTQITEFKYTKNAANGPHVYCGGVMSSPQKYLRSSIPQGQYLQQQSDTNYGLPNQVCFNVEK